MCDCYGHKCEKCNEILSVHLEDFDTEREEIKVFCENHLPRDMSDGTLWEWSDSEADTPRKWFKMFIRPLTENARANYRGNCPNTWHSRIVT